MKRRYNREFKVKACELVLTDGIKRSVVAEKLGINVVMLYRWIDEYQTLGEAAFVGSGHQRPENARLKQLEKENERLRMANEILKKAEAYLANQQGDEKGLTKQS